MNQTGNARQGLIGKRLIGKGLIAEVFSAKALRAKGYAVSLVETA